MSDFSRDLSRRINRFMQLPRRSNDSWQGAVVPLPLFMRDAGTNELVREWAIAWANLATDEVVLSSASAAEAEDRERVLAAFLDLGLKNRKVREGRPARLEVEDASLGAFIKDALRDAELEVVVLPALRRIAQEVEDLVRAEHGDDPPPGALDAPGVTVERMRAFADAASRLHGRAPWVDVGHEDLIVVEQPPPPDGMACFTANDEDGGPCLEFYSSQEQFEEADEEPGAAHHSNDHAGNAHPPDEVLDDDLDAVEDDDLGDDEFDDPSLGWRLDYGRIDQLPVYDVGLWADMGLPVAGPAAYPVLIKPIGFREFRRSEGDRLAFVEGLLRAVADTTEDEIDSGTWTHTVDTADGPVTYRLSMPSVLPKTDEARNAQEEVDRSVARLTRFFTEHMFEDMEAALAEVERLGSSVLEYPEPRTPAEHAQDLVFRSSGAVGRRRIHLLRAALTLWPDCFDASVYMGEISRDPRKALAFFEAALASGERVVPAAVLTERQGSYWGHYQTRMLLRARFGLATTLKDLGRAEEAEREYRTLLALDESDHGAAAPHLLALLLESGRDAEASGLLSRFDHEGPEWAYGRTLWAFRNQTRPDAREALQLGLTANRRVARLLALAAPDHDAYPETDDDPDDPGADEDAHDEVEEAFDCATLLARAWRSTPGAIEWLGNQLARRQQGRSRHGRSRRRRRR